MTPGLNLVGVTKSFSAVVLRDLTLSVAPGEVYALLGPNGAGKTTAMRIAAGLLRPDSGVVEVHGIDLSTRPRDAKALTAWLPAEPLLYDRLTPFEYLEFVAGLWSVPAALAQARAEEQLTDLGLWDKRTSFCETLSRGQKQLVMLAGALVHAPRLILMDEPLTGLDAAASRHVREVVRRLAAAGTSVLITTHMLDAAERLADRVGILRHGRLLREGTAADLRASTDAGDLESAFLRIVESA